MVSELRVNRRAKYSAPPQGALSVVGEADVEAAVKQDPVTHFITSSVM